MSRDLKNILKKAWYFIWEDDSIWSWLVNIVLAFVLIKFIVYPGLGFLLQTSYPVVAVVSESMEHSAGSDYNGRLVLCDKIFDKKESISYNAYWDFCGSWYESNVGITKEEFREFPFKNGFNKGDIMVLRGAKPENIRIGDVMVFISKKPDPIIHRVVRKWKDSNGQYLYHTKGDHNKASIKDSLIDETSISQSNVVGKAVLRIPFLGYIKIWFTELICYAPVKQVISSFYPLAC